ncbi:MAG: imidazoleglycerol-phosphate dehydratase [Methanobacteriota archaeon]|nr:MAG: imidazoleglycerol-phosphate dehydratase [Euryarchaeota archaeon]
MTSDAPKRRSSLTRETRETKVQVSLVIEGEGNIKCDVPDEFLRHMVETLARYSGVDMDISASGDLEHHLAEDVAITMGRAYREAIGNAPIRRIASAVVPMDEALVQATIDIIDRPYAHLELPDETYSHFVRSFAMELRATVHTVVLRGKDEHHIIEATFKALGKALHEAMSRTGSILSTKSSVKWGVE